MTMFSFSKGDSNRSAFATRMLLYIEPLLLRFKKELAGVKIAGHPLKVGGHVDNQFFFVEKNDDISDDPETPKIFTENIMSNPKVSLSYLTSPILFPPIKEHLFFILHNLLLTRVRKKRFNIYFDDNCTHCKQAPEDLQHIFYCPASQPAVKWMRRKIEAIDPSLTKENDLSIFTLAFRIVDTTRKFSVIWLVANFISAIWHSRIEPSDKIIARVLADIIQKLKT